MESKLPILRISSICKVFESDRSSSVSALNHISFDVKKSEFISIVGPSGCGKTTLLKIIASLLPPTSGSISSFNEENNSQIMLVFQEYSRSLFPWRTVFKNISFGLEQLKLDKIETKNRVNEYLAIVKLSDFSMRYPWELSGGMQQRVAIARALACETQILLMDEPFGSLDALSRATLEDDLLKLWEKLDLTLLFVTHDIDEAIYLSDRVICLTKRPAKIAEDFEILLPRPRNQIETKNLKQFGKYRKKIHGLLNRNV